MELNYGTEPSQCSSESRQVRVLPVLPSQFIPIVRFPDVHKYCLCSSQFFAVSSFPVCAASVLYTVMWKIKLSGEN